jgi:outer membrane protein TolC
MLACSTFNFLPRELNMSRSAVLPAHEWHPDGCLRRKALVPVFFAAMLCGGAAVLAQERPAQAPPAADAPDSALDLRTYVRQIQGSNRAIKSKQAERDIAATGVERARSAFDPVLAASTQRSHTRQENTLEEDLIRQNLGVYERSATDVSVGVTQLLPSGAKVEGKATLSKFITNIKQNQRPEEGSDVRTFYGVTVTQPLLRDFGAKITGARVRVAEIDTALAGAASRDTETSVVAEALFAYWDLALAQYRLSLSADKRVMGERLLQQARDLGRQGRLSESEVADVQTNLALFEAGWSEARMTVQERSNRLRTLLMRSAVEGQPALTVTEALPSQPVPPMSADVALGVARDKREDLRVRRLAIEREEVQVAYARNQAKPRVDVVAAYGLNGFGATELKALRVDGDSPTWNVGVQLSMPLGANRQGQADVEAARLRRGDAMLQLRALEAAVSNDIDTAISMMNSAAQRWALWEDVARREQVQVDQERRRLAAGRSAMREILFREEKAINARLAVIEQQVAWVKAQVLLDAAQGILLERFQ